MIFAQEFPSFPVETLLLTQSSNGLKTPEKTNTFPAKSGQPFFMEFPFLMASSKEEGNTNISFGIPCK